MFFNRDDLLILDFAISDSFAELGQPLKRLNLVDFLRFFFSSDQISPNDNSNLNKGTRQKPLPD